MLEIVGQTLARVAEVGKFPVNSLARVSEVGELLSLRYTPPRADPGTEPPDPPTSYFCVVVVRIGC